MKLFLFSLAILLTLIGQAQNMDFKKKNFATEDDYNKANNALEKGDELFFAGNFEKALPRFLEAQALNPSNALLNFKIGACYLKNEELKKSMPYFKTAKELDPKVDPKIDFALAQAYQASGRYDEAVESYHIYLAGLSKSKKALEEDKVQKQIDICSTEIQKKQSKMEQEKELANTEGTKEKMPESTLEPTIPTSKELVVETKTPMSQENEKKVVEATKSVEKKEVSKTPSAVVKTTAVSASKPDKISYRIQIASTARLASANDLKNIYSGSLKITNQKIGGRYKYFIGDFPSKEEAMKAKSVSGISDAFIVKFQNGKKL